MFKKTNSKQRFKMKNDNLSSMKNNLEIAKIPIEEELKVFVGLGKLSMGLKSAHGKIPRTPFLNAKKRTKKK